MTKTFTNQTVKENLSISQRFVWWLFKKYVMEDLEHISGIIADRNAPWKLIGTWSVKIKPHKRENGKLAWPGNEYYYVRVKERKNKRLLEFIDNVTVDKGNPFIRDDLIKQIYKMTQYVHALSPWEQGMITTEDMLLKMEDLNKDSKKYFWDVA